MCYIKKWLHLPDVVLSKHWEEHVTLLLHKSKAISTVQWRPSSVSHTHKH